MTTPATGKLDAYLEAVGRVTLAGAVFERTTRHLHAQLLRSKNGMIEPGTASFAKSYDGIWAILKAFDIPDSARIAAALSEAAALWHQRNSVVHSVHVGDASQNAYLINLESETDAVGVVTYDLHQLCALSEALRTHSAVLAALTPSDALPRPGSFTA